jgi:hypothetical protein
MGGWIKMNRFAAFVTLVAMTAYFGPWFPAAAETAPRTAVKPKSAQGHKVPLRHDQLTLYPHGRPARRQPAYSYTRHRFDQPTPIHNTFMGAHYY